MFAFRLFLIAKIVLIYGFTGLAVLDGGLNFISPYFVGLFGFDCDPWSKR